MVKIRLRRVGAKKQPHYRVVVTDSRAPRDGKSLETIGYYNPRTEPPTVEIDAARALYWLGVGAQPSEAVKRMLDQQGILARAAAIKRGEVPPETEEDAWQRLAETVAAEEEPLDLEAAVAEAEPLEAEEEAELAEEEEELESEEDEYPEEQDDDDEYEADLYDEEEEDEELEEDWEEEEEEADDEETDDYDDDDDDDDWELDVDEDEIDNEDDVDEDEDEDENNE
jgi:small subunit ribosomal protein S16